MYDLVKIEKIIYEVKSKMDAHNKFKEAYNQQLAFDFSLFNFFSIGENKVSQVLAFFLDVNQNHGQKDIFLKEFLRMFYENDFEIVQIENRCEKPILNNRRIDIYIKLKNLTIAIENKIWADDQHNQLKDYLCFLNNVSSGEYKMFYLNPYGLQPSSNSINENLKEQYIAEGKLEIIGYKQHIIPLISRWISICEADNVTYFLKEFKKYLETKFLGKNTINMSKELTDLLYQNQKEVTAIVNEYKRIENEINNVLNELGKQLKNINPILSEGISLSKSNVFNYGDSRVYKFSIAKGTNKIWIQYSRDSITFNSSYYLQEGTDEVFKDILKDLGINHKKPINHKLSKNELIKIFLDQVEIANKSFSIYEDKYELINDK